MNTLSLNGNWVDLVILIIFAYYASEAWRIGLWVILSDFLAFLASLVIALIGYKTASSYLETSFALYPSLSNALGFLMVAGLSQTILSFLFGLLVARIPHEYWHKKWSKALAIFPALGEGIIIVSFLVTFILSFPLNPQVKQAVSESKIGGALLSKTSGLENTIDEIFGGVVEESLTYLTVRPQSGESISLRSTPGNLQPDPETEAEMVRLVNEERKSKGVGQLTLRRELIPVARAHATDMWKRSYFSHYSPEGKDVGDRLDNANVRYNFAGENLALAPTLATAHHGLMNSPGHRANILEPKFKQIGIGVIDNGYEGKMFVQIFTD